MNTNQPAKRDAATVAYVETSMASLADALRQACALIDRLSATNLRDVLAKVDESLTPQADYKSTAGHVWLSPNYFALANEVNDMRTQLACALVVVEIRDCIALTKTLLDATRQREPACPDPQTIFDRLTHAICGALDVAAMPQNAPWRAMIERAVYPLSDLWAEARALL